MSTNNDMKNSEELLKILYNIKGEDSYVIKSIKDNITNLNTEKEDLEEKLNTANNTQEELLADLECINKGASLAEEFFDLYDENSDLQRYFSLLNVDFDPSAARSAVNVEVEENNLKNSVTEDIANLEEDIKNIENKQEENEIELNEAEEKLSDAEHTRNGLDSLVNDILNGNNSYNRDYVEGILKKINELSGQVVFENEEIPQLGCLILFPETGLYEFNEKINNNEIDVTDISASSEDNDNEIDNDVDDDIEKDEPISQDYAEENKEEIEEIKAPIIEETSEEGIFKDEEEPKEENVEENVQPEEVNEENDEIINLDDYEVNNDESEKEEPTEENSDTYAMYSSPMEIEENQEETTNNEEEIKPDIEIQEQTEIEPEEQPQPTEESVNPEEQYTQLGLDINKFNKDKDEVLELLNAVEIDTVKNNLEELKALNANDKVIYYIKDNYMYLTDPELSAKINFLRAKLIKDSEIDLVLQVGTLANSTISDIKRRANDIEQGFTAKDLFLLEYEPKDYYNNLNYLKQLGIELDDKEKEIYKICLLENKENIEPDIEILKEYGISIYRKNGKNELGVFWKNSHELVDTVDDIIEIGEEDVLNTTPEIMAMKTDRLLEKITYCRNNNIEYIDNSNGKSYADFIYKVGLFKEKVGEVQLPIITTKKENNDNLRLINDDSNINYFVDSLDDYYNNFNNEDSNLNNPEEIETFNKLKTILETDMKAEIIGKNTYFINGENISRNKFERNLKYLIKSLSSSTLNLEELSSELILIALLYNSRKSKEVIEDFTNKYLNKNNVGGASL